MPASSTGMDWTDQTITTLRTLWSEGHSTAEIGRRMETTKNAIVGKAHRLQLPARPSPIRGAPRTDVKSVPHAKPSVPTLASLLPSRPIVPPPPPPPQAALRPMVEAAPSPVVTTPIPARAPQPPSVRPVVPAASRSAGICQWPIGEPGKAGFHLCGDEPAPGKPYCSSHCGRAYVRVREGAAAGTAS